MPDDKQSLTVLPACERCDERQTLPSCSSDWIVGLVLTGAATANAQVADHEKLAAAFAEADNNADGYVDVDEYVAYMVRAFAGLDKDRDGYLMPTDIPKTPAERFARIDRDGDGRISLGEGVAEKMIDYFAIDTNLNGVFSFEELLAYEQKKSGS